MTDETPEPRRRWLDLGLLFLVLAGSMASAGFLLSRFLRHPRLLWSDVIHDRSAHLLSGMNLAVHLRLHAWSQVFADLDGFRSWPPLHDGFCVGLCVGFAGGDECWAVLPSLIAWIGSVVFAYMLAEKALGRGGKIAGLTAALFVLVSPAQRAYATDVMLESLGSCLTLACLYAYVVARQTDTPRAWRGLAVALTLLFLEKYNYWFLVVFGLGADWLTAEPSRYQGLLERLKARFSDSKRRAWLSRQARRPLNYLISALILLAAVITLAHWDETTLFGKPIRLAPIDNLSLGIYILLLIRLAPWYRRSGQAWIAAQASPRLRELCVWHLWPVALWFLWPHHLYSFLWVNNPAANAGEFPRHDLFGGYPYYALCLVNDYHIRVWSGVLAVGLFLVGVWAAVHRRLRPGTSAIFWMVAIAFFLTVHHPLRQSRFLHTLLPALWVGAGIGAASLLPESRDRKSRFAAALYLGGLGILGLLHVPGLWAEAHAPEGGISAARSSALDITDAYLPDLADSRSVAVFSNMPIKQFAQWTYLQRYNRLKKLEAEISGFNPLVGDNRTAFDAWRQKTDCDTVVYVDFSPGSLFWQNVPSCENLRQYGDMLEKQRLFTLTARHAFPQYGCTATVWKRARLISLRQEVP